MASVKTEHTPAPPQHTHTRREIIPIIAYRGGLEIATDTVAKATNIFSLATKNSSLVAKVATRFFYNLDLN